MRLALYCPDIPQNTGTLLRLTACLGVAVDVIGPTGFDMTDRALRRAALDYLDHVHIARHRSFADFEEERRRVGSRLVLLTTRAAQAHTAFAFRPTDTLLLGRESAGVPDDVHAAADASIRIPMQPHLRSLNVAVAAAIVLGEALRQTGGFPGEAGAAAVERQRRPPLTLPRRGGKIPHEGVDSRHEGEVRTGGR